MGEVRGDKFSVLLGQGVCVAVIFDQQLEGPENRREPSSRNTQGAAFAHVVLVTHSSNRMPPASLAKKTSVKANLAAQEARVRKRKLGKRLSGHTR